MDRRFVQATSISELASPVFLSGLLGEVRSFEREPMTTVGFSGTQFERLRVELTDGRRATLVLKHIHPEKDATAWRTNGGAREAQLLSERALDDVWRVFDAPYLAYAFDGVASAVLMRDLSAHLFPDVREPLARADEDALIDALAALHTMFWDRAVRGTSWLAKGEFMFSFLAPGGLDEWEARGRAHRLYGAIKTGWELAQAQLPQSVWTLLASPPDVMARITDGLPRTIIHGDPKVANFAILPNGRVSAFDWATIADGCATLDMGLFITVNASRLTRSKEEVLAAYRVALEHRLGHGLGDALWARMCDAAILAGAAVLLWNKALNMKNGLPGAAEEWNWWVGQLHLVDRRLEQA